MYVSGKTVQQVADAAHGGGMASMAGMVEIDSYGAWGVLVFFLLLLIVGGMGGFFVGNIWKGKWKLNIAAGIFIFLFFICAGVVDAMNYELYIKGDRIPLANYVAGIVSFSGAIITIVLLYKAGVTQKKIYLNDRYTAAVTLLGNDSASSIITGLFSLHKFAIEYKEYRAEVVNVISRYIRAVTKEEDYDKNYENKPSPEIQTAIDLLFRDVDGVKGLYKSEVASSLPLGVNLSDSYLAGANFRNAECQGASFHSAELRRATFDSANCVCADFNQAKCIGTVFVQANCSGANFHYAHCVGAHFGDAICYGAFFWGTEGQGAYLNKAKCQGALFCHARMQGAYFDDAECQGANFFRVECQGATFEGAKLQGACAYSIDDPLIFSGEYFSDIENRANALSDQVGQETQLDDVTFTGDLGENVQRIIQEAKIFLGGAWNERVWGVLCMNQDEDSSSDIPSDSGMVRGILEDNGDIQKIVCVLRKIAKKFS